LTTLALSVITAHHEQLIGQLITQFGIQATKAYQLVIKSKEPVILQLEAWPFRDAKPWNLAGWMIQAIESNYDVPDSYREHRIAQLETQKLQERQDAINACGWCDAAGFRYLTTEQYPQGAYRRCSHDTNLERRISLDAQNSTESDRKIADEEKDL